MMHPWVAAVLRVGWAFPPASHGTQPSAGPSYLLAGFGGTTNGTVLKNPPATQGTRVHSLGREGPLGEEVAAHSRILAWKNPMDRRARQVTVHGMQSWTQA